MKRVKEVVQCEDQPHGFYLLHLSCLRVRLRPKQKNWQRTEAKVFLKQTRLWMSPETAEQTEDEHLNEGENTNASEEEKENQIQGEQR